MNDNIPPFFPWSAKKTACEKTDRNTAEYDEMGVAFCNTHLTSLIAFKV